MGRQPNTDALGIPFTASLKDRVWRNRFGDATSGRDACDNLIERVQYGNTGSQYGWEIDHKKPVAKGGGDEESNLQPLQWEENRKKGDTYPWHC